MRLIIRLFLLSVSVVLVGCGPTTFVVGLSPGNQELVSTVIEEADGRTRDRVAVIDVSGMIMNGRTPGLLQQGENPVSRFREELDEARDDKHIKAVVLRLNTPGGAVTATDMMYRDLQLFKEQTGKPVVVLMMDVAASGGYYLSCAGDHVIAYPTTVTASIGVIIQTMSLQPALARIGIETDAITSGPNKDAGSPLSAPNENHRAVFQQVVDEMYASFTDVVRQARPDISKEDFAEVTDGRIVTGKRAHEVGLIDQLGDLDDAFAKAKSLAGISDASMIRYHRVLEYVGSPYAAVPGRSEASAGGAQVNLFQLNLGGGLGAMAEPGFYYVWLPGVR